MVEVWIVVLRGVQYVAAAILFGLPAFMLYSARAVGPLSLRWPRPVLAGAAAVLMLAAPAALLAQAVLMAGSLSEAIRPEALTFMMAGMGLGKALAVRMLAAALALGAALRMQPGAGLWRWLALSGAVVSASFAWTGHGAATQGAGHLIHLASDIAHALAASIWIGALTAFVVLIARRPSASPEYEAALARSLTGFAGIGAATVGVLVVTGLINSVWLVGLSKAPSLWASPYGVLLTIKLGLFGLMLCLAADNRFRLAPLMARDAKRALPLLKRSLWCEFILGMAILVLVAVMGVQPPPSAL